MVSFILLAAGRGTRIEQQTPKQYLTIAGKPLLLHLLDKLANIKEINQLIICCELEYKELVEKMIHNHCPHLPYEIVEGGSTRQQSVWHGLQVCTNDVVVIHEAARPFVKSNEFTRLINDDADNVIYGIDIPFTVLKGQQTIEEVLNRDELINVQLPQKFSTSLLTSAYEQAILDQREFTEDASLFYSYQPTEKVNVLKGSEYNIKITYPIDFLIGETIYKEYILRQEV